MSLEDWASELGSEWDVIDASGKESKELAEAITEYNKPLFCVFNALDSSNTFAREIPIDALQGKQLVLLAEEQTAGYGRLGRTWFSDAKACLTFTWISSTLSNPFMGWLPLIAALSISEMMAEFVDDERQIDIKWPNDVFIAGKKVAGILMENKHVKPKSLLYVGVGMNILETSFPSELSTIADTLIHHCTSKEPTREKCLASFLKHFKAILSEFEMGNINGIKQAYEARSSYVENKAVAFILKGKRYEAVTCGLTGQGELCCRDKEDGYHELNISEIETLRSEI